MDMFTQSTYLKKTHNLYFLFIIPDIFKAIKIFKVVCLVIW